MTSKTLCVLALITLAGCRSERAAQADGRIVFDKQGCAFQVRPNVGDTSFVLRLKDADQSGCKLP